MRSPLGTTQRPVVPRGLVVCRECYPGLALAAARPSWAISFRPAGLFCDKHFSATCNAQSFGDGYRHDERLLRQGSRALIRSLVLTAFSINPNLILRNQFQQHLDQ